MHNGEVWGDRRNPGRRLNARKSRICTKTANAAGRNPANDKLRDAVRENWVAICTRIVRGPVQTRLTSFDTRDLHEPLRELFEEQKTSFKVNVSYGFILKEK